MTLKIFLDPGHDINTPGKGVAGMKEFEFNRAVAQKIANLLAGYEGVAMVFSHDLNDGIDDPLPNRVKKANDWGADVFVSIHANAASSTEATGIETWIDPEAPQETLNLASVVHGELIRDTGMRNRGIKRSNFYVLDKTKMNAFLAECGFMTNSNDLANLMSEEYRLKCATAILNGLAKVYGLKKKPVPAPTIQTKPLPVFTVTVRDFNSMEAVNEFMAHSKEKYPTMGYHVQQLR